MPSTMVLVAAASGVPSNVAEDPMDSSNVCRAMGHFISTNDKLFATGTEYENGLNVTSPNDQEDGDTNAT